MKVIERNFFKLLQSGIYDQETAPVEPLSPWKWRRLYQLSLMHGVAALVHDGIKHGQDQLFIRQIPTKLQQQWQKTTDDIERNNRETDLRLVELFAQLAQAGLHPYLLRGQATATCYRQPLHRTCGDIDLWFPTEEEYQQAIEWAKENGSELTEDDDRTSYEWNSRKIEYHTKIQALTNPLLNKKLQGIISSGMQEQPPKTVSINRTPIAVVPPTLNALLMLVRMACYILNEGVSMKQTTDFAMLMMHNKNDIDFTELQNHIQHLGLQSMADLTGTLLTELLGMQQEVIPFMRKANRRRANALLNDLFDLRDINTEDWYFTQGKDIFVRSSNSNAMFWHLRHGIKYVGTYPSETMTNFFSSMAHSLSHIEE